MSSGAGFDERLIREARFHEWQGSLNGFAESYIMASPPLTSAGAARTLFSRSRYSPRLRSRTRASSVA